MLICIPSPFISPLLPKSAAYSKPPTTPSVVQTDDDTTLSSIRCVGVHNGCHVANLLSLIIYPWSYTHISILSQLKLGLRHIEIDTWYERNSSDWFIFHEFVDPLTNETPDRTRDCLIEIRNWSRSNPDHHPVYIYFDVKGAYYRGCSGMSKLFGFGNFTSSSSSSSSNKTCPEYVNLDSLISSVFSNSQHVFRPCDLSLKKSSSSSSLKSRFNGWPRANSLRGRVFFVLNTTFGERGSYDQLRPGAMMFRRCIDRDGFSDDKDSLFYETRNMDFAKRYLEQGYIVRTLLNRTGDDVRLEREITEAFRIGIQYIACDNLRVASRIFRDGRYCYYDVEEKKTSLDDVNKIIISSK